MVVEFTSLGSSFRLTSRLAQSTKKLTGMTCYSGCNRRKVSSFLRVITSYFDIRVRFWAGNDIHNFHLLALPMNKRHTGQSMFGMVAKVLDVIRTVWRDSLIGVATDGARNMTGLHVGLLTFLDNATGPNFIRVWCGAHQLDFIMADVYQNLLQDDFYSVLVALIGYLRRQQNLIAEMKTTCPKVAITRWLSMIKVMTWFKKHRIAVQAYLDEKLPSCRPSAAWWVLMMTVHSFAQEASLVLTRLQGMTTLVSQQVVELSNLSQTFCRLVGGKGPLLQSELQAMAEETADSGGHVATGEFAAPLSNVEQFVRGLGTFVSAKLDEIPAENGARLHVLRLVGLAFLSAALQLMSIRVERNSANEQVAANDQLSPVMPHELVKYRRSQFCATVCKHILRLQAAKFTPQQIEDIEEEHGELI
ncbi:hypothetical protein BASA60_011317 [Batrachochytrium salamandrivorans]|nr:hypothetical protein BASA60_011317 [Batrachochytrium salamandrivorans]KAH9266179.1 hypothetical protein BASA84_001223 [Batrachochytrium salamandrivorans]